MSKIAPGQPSLLTKKRALRFILLMGGISLFADMTYEGARSVTGPYLAILGASGFIVGIVSGIGELAGYSIRFISGYITDRTRSYWMVTFIGFAINLLAVSLLALTNQISTAVALIIFERLGKAIRTPARDAMLSHATQAVGRGWGFGLHEALDQMGAILGPLLVAAILIFQHNYKIAFAFLLIPACSALLLLLFSYLQFPHPEKLEISSPSIQTNGFGKNYWLFVAALCSVGIGFVDFPLIAYHFGQEKMAPLAIPLLYALAMAIEGISALLMGKWFDRYGMIVLIFSICCSSFAAPLTFLGNFPLAGLGMCLWGIGMGGQESLVRAIISQLTGIQCRATAFGLFHFLFGIFWFCGSAFMGYLYDHYLTGLIIFSVGTQLASLPFLFKLYKFLKLG